MDNDFQCDDVVTLTDEDGKDSEFCIIGIKELDGVTYYALTPLSEENSEEYVILKAEEDENGDITLNSIDDDEEFDRIADLFDDELFSDIDHDDTDSD